MIHGPRNTTLNDDGFRKSLTRFALGLAFAGTALMALGQGGAVARFKAVMSLGSDSILLTPAKQRLNMLLSVECPEFENIVVTGTGHDSTVTDIDGNHVRYYPREIAFRFTIGSRTSADETTPNEIETRATADHFQSNLHFRLKVFHGMVTKTYEPTEMGIIGVPTDMPYDERIYHFSFNLKDIPVDDRMMLEVLDEQGNRIAKFHLQLI